MGLPVNWRRSLIYYFLPLLSRVVCGEKYCLFSLILLLYIYMLSMIWHDFLYQPLFNFLIWVYNNFTDHSLGWAIVYLTIVLRVVLLPFTLVNEKNRVRNEELVGDIKRLDKELSNDPILKKEEVRRVIKKRKVSPWSKVAVLGVQALVLVLLYQVFLRGITGEKILKILYKSVEFPGKINTNFYGFDLGAEHGWIWAGIVGLFLLGQIYLSYRNRKVGLNKGDLAYFILFPLSVFIVLWILPMVKALFIFTSILFSVLIRQISKILFRKSEDKKDEKKGKK